METPFGRALATYDDRDAYYADHPQNAPGWDVEGHVGDAPLGWDIQIEKRKDWLLVFCCPFTDASGPSSNGDVVAYEAATDKVALPN